MLLRRCIASSSTGLGLGATAVQQQQQSRGLKTVTPISGTGSATYQNSPIKKSGMDELVRHTEVYDGYTDDMGSFKEGPPLSLRLEYIRSLEHSGARNRYTKYIWSPFEADNTYKHYTPFFFDHERFSSRNYFGRRSGTDPGCRTILGHYRRREMQHRNPRVAINHHPVRRVPKWLACICHYPQNSSYVGFFLYANGSYAAELLTFKQLPRIVYNKPFQASIPTLGQTVDLTEVTYGKDLHSLEMYPGYGAKIARASGTSAVVLRGSEPGLVPVMLPSKEVRLFDTSCYATFGRRAGVMSRETQWAHYRDTNRYKPGSPRIHAKSKSVSTHPAGGGNGTGFNLVVPLNWRVHPRNQVRHKYWLSGYIIRGRQQNKSTPAADIKSKAYSWASRDKIYR